MSAILGVSAFYHDSAAALVEDGRIVAAAQEERFTRKKHDASFPSNAIRYCLEQGGLAAGDVDHVVFYEKPFIKFERLLETYLALAPSGYNSFRLAIPLWLKEKLFQKRLLRQSLKEIDPDIDWEQRMLFTDHHQSHAASAFFASPFEEAAVLHERWHKVKAATALADELVRPVPRLRGVIVQAAAKISDQPEQAAVFMLNAGCIAGPERLSTLGVRAVKEQTSVGSSLFAQPLMLQAVPLEGEVEAGDSPEVRAEVVLSALESHGEATKDLALLSDHLSLLRRWYYRPEKQRVGEIFFPNHDGAWPVRRILRGAARMALGEPGVMAETQRDGVKAAKVRILHEGREGVERVVPVVPKGGES